jgi:hypothetical protein
VYFHDEKVEKFDKVNVPSKAPRGPDEGPPIQKFPVL